MSRTIRRPPPRRRLRAGYVKRLCWRCRGRVSDCSCPARDLVAERAERVATEDEIARTFEPSPLEDCECEWCVRELQDIASDWHWSKHNEDWWPFVANAQGPLGQPLALKLIDASPLPQERNAQIDRYNRVRHDADAVRRWLLAEDPDEDRRFDEFLARVMRGE